MKTGTVNEYLSTLSGWQAAAARALRDAILASAAGPELKESIKWAQPVYESIGPVCYFKAHANHITFGFWRGAELMSVDDRLQTSGSKMAHLKIRSVQDVEPHRIAALVNEAVALNRMKGDPTQRR